MNIKFCVKLGKSTTETYSQCMVMKCYHVHVCLNGKRFHKGWETTEDDGRSGRVFLRKFRWVQILLATKSSNYHPNVKLPEHQLFWRKALAPECKYTILIFMLSVLELSRHRLYILAMYIIDLEESYTIFYKETPLGTVKIQCCF